MTLRGCMEKKSLSKKRSSKNYRGFEDGSPCLKMVK